MLPQEIARRMIDCFDRGGKILICGNGGSAAETQHFAAELVGHFEKERIPLPAISLTTDTSIITAIGNDDGYDAIFGRQVYALGKRGDLLITLTTSGKSANILVAEKVALEKEMDIVRFPIKEEMESTAKCQERHLVLIHDICGLIDTHYAHDTHAI